MRSAGKSLHFSLGVSVRAEAGVSAWRGGSYLHCIIIMAARCALDPILTSGEALAVLTAANQ